MVLFWILTVRFLISKRPMRQELRLSAEAQACCPGTWELEAVECSTHLSQPGLHREFQPVRTTQ